MIVGVGTHRDSGYVIELCGPEDRPYYVGSCSMLGDGEGGIVCTLGYASESEARRAIETLIDNHPLTALIAEREQVRKEVRQAEDEEW